ncbi:MAG: HPF/RaiA family ribosome-associated protein [Lentimicrobium sp.]|nr:HPF/RaiA family ribosome-associated protein [Lentimicrobium sp.]
MKIQFYIANSSSDGRELIVPTTARLTKELSRFNERKTSVEVHLSDEKVNYNRPEDKRCLILIKVHGMPPITISGHAESYENAVNEAILKLKLSLLATYGRLRVYL